MKKRLFSILIAVCMLFTMLPTGAFAEETAAWNGTDIDTDWYTADATEYVIDTPAQLAGLAAIVNGTAADIDQDTFTGKTVKLGADIDLGGNDWTPIAVIENYVEISAAFCGTFDGQNYSIKNLYMNTSDYHTGLFGYIQDATIKNVNIVEAKIIACIDIANAILVTYGVDATISNCSIDSDSYIINNAEDFVQNTAGIASFLVASSPSSEAALIENCINNASVSAVDYSTIVAGIVAQTNAPIRNCLNNGDISGDDGVGGVAGYCELTEITNCINTGDVTGTYSMIGGIIGAHDSFDDVHCTISKCYNSGTITGGYQVGGIAGYLNTGAVEDCYNTGAIAETTNSETYNAVGGIAGQIFQNTETSSVTRCHNVGTVTGVSAGSIVGRNEGTVTNCAYLEETVAVGTVDGGSEEGNEAFSETQFKNGEVQVWLESKVTGEKPVWVQNLEGETPDEYPVLESSTADYSDVDAAIAEAEALDPDDYEDFSAVEAAIEAVVRGKSVAEQDEVDAMAQAIYDAIDALVEKEDEDEPIFRPGTKPDPCDHDFDEDGLCKECGVKVISSAESKPDDETNPNTGAENASAIVCALAVVSAAALMLGKKK